MNCSGDSLVGFDLLTRQSHIDLIDRLLKLAVTTANVTAASNSISVCDVTRKQASNLTCTAYDVQDDSARKCLVSAWAQLVWHHACTHTHTQVDLV